METLLKELDFTPLCQGFDRYWLGFWKLKFSIITRRSCQHQAQWAMQYPCCGRIQFSCGYHHDPQIFGSYDCCNYTWMHYHLTWSQI